MFQFIPHAIRCNYLGSVLGIIPTLFRDTSDPCLILFYRQFAVSRISAWYYSSGISWYFGSVFEFIPPTIRCTSDLFLASFQMYFVLHMQTLFNPHVFCSMNRVIAAVDTRERFLDAAFLNF